MRQYRRILLSAFFCLAILFSHRALCTAQTSPSFFGMSETNPGRNGWPSVGFQTFRTLNCYPYVSWKDLNPSKGVYQWGNLDHLVNVAQSRGLDVLYTFGRTPAWASSNPTGYCKDAVPGSCYPPSNQKYWKDFVKAISVRYAGKIKSWEIWNEPNAANSWTGTTAQMVTMAQNAYQIVKAVAPGALVLSPGAQGPNAYTWLDQYLAAGGGPYADGFAFHGYVGSTNGVVNPPERIVPLISTIKSVQSRYGQSSKPLWDTEHSWLLNTKLPNQDQQAAWLARHLILSRSNGVTRSIWYAWDTPDIGTLWDRTNGIHKPGTAYGQVYKWLVGATLNLPCSAASDSTWSCVFTRRDGQQAEVRWKASGGTATKTAPGRYTHYRDLDGNSFAIPATGSVTIGPKPILLLTPGSF